MYPYPLIIHMYREQFAPRILIFPTITFRSRFLGLFHVLEVIFLYYIRFLGELTSQLSFSCLRGAR